MSDSPTFCHLHTHSHYSLLNAVPKINELVEVAKADGMPALALTDDGNMYGTIEFFQECQKQEIKPIIGVDFFLALRSRNDKQAGVDKGWHRLVLLSENIEGYRNLIKLVTAGYLEGFYYKPRIDKDILKEHTKGLVCIIPSFSGEIVQALKNNNTEKANSILDQYKSMFDEDHLYLEITHHPEIPNHEKNMEDLVSFARKTNTKIVASHDTYYLKPEDRQAREVLNAVGSQREVSEFNNQEDDFSFISQKEALKRFKKEPDAIENIGKIVDMCNLDLKLGVWKFPDFKIKSGKTPDDELRDLAYKGLERRQLELTDEVKDRIEYELGVIKEKGYSKYFLAVADLLRFAKENEILSNTRGSAAGSLVSYLVGITIVDPIKLNLPFERFLNPERPSAPDIDMDFADADRDKVIEYSREKYGKDRVAQIGTFGTMMARGAVRDVARALGYPYAVGDKIAKLIPFGSQGFPMTIKRALEIEPDLKKLYKEDSEAKEILDMAQRIEGCARHIGIHAAGVVISPDPLTDDVPLQYDPKGENKLITQYDMHAVGEDGAGLLKFDFLGLKNLTIMGKTLKLIRKLRGEEIDIDHIPLDDKKTYAMLSRGETAATFQLNGQGMTQFLKQLKPTDINDINAMVALYRPGPMAFIPDYIERKNYPQKVKYIDDRFKDILEPTFGILIYQDDIMLIAVHFAGYSWGEADKFRKAMGKKIPELMAEQKEKFFKGCQEVGGLSERQTKDLWESIETFAAYGFNKAHAASYGRIAYLTSYLKANYPVLYMTSVLTADSGDTDKISEMVAECKRMNIEVLPPAINESFADFTVVEDPNDPEKEAIRFGLCTIKNFGSHIAEVIIEDRKKEGAFTSLENFLTRINDRNLNRKSLEALIKCGALDDFGERGQMLDNLEDLIAYSKETKDGKEQNQDSLFGLMNDSSSIPKLRLKDCPPAPMKEKLAWEKELLGLYISGHPLDAFDEKFRKNNNSISNIKETGLNGMSLVIGGIISEAKEIFTQKGDKMCFLTISDKTDSLEAVVFPKTFEEYKDFCIADQVVAVKGKLNKRNDEWSLVVDKIKLLGEKKLPNPDSQNQD